MSPVTTTPLPAARPSSLTTYGAPKASSAASISCGGGADVAAGGGHSGRGHHVLGERLGALQPAPPPRTGRRAGMPRVAHGVGDARDQRGLRADDDQLGRRARWRGRRRRRRRGRRPACSSATSAMPALPGAQCRAVTSGSRDRERHRACSRAPPPMTRTFTLCSLLPRPSGTAAWGPRRSAPAGGRPSLVVRSPAPAWPARGHRSGREAAPPWSAPSRSGTAVGGPVTGGRRCHGTLSGESAAAPISDPAPLTGGIPAILAARPAVRR